MNIEKYRVSHKNNNKTKLSGYKLEDFLMDVFETIVFIAVLHIFVFLYFVVFYSVNLKKILKESTQMSDVEIKEMMEQESILIHSLRYSRDTIREVYSSIFEKIFT